MMKPVTLRKIRNFCLWAQIVPIALGVGLWAGNAVEQQPQQPWRSIPPCCCTW